MYEHDDVLKGPNCEYIFLTGALAEEMVEGRKGFERLRTEMGKEHEKDNNIF